MRRGLFALVTALVAGAVVLVDAPAMAAPDPVNAQPVGGSVPLALGEGPIAASADGAYLFVADTTTPKLSMVKVADETSVGTAATLAAAPLSIAVSADGSKVVVLEAGGGVETVVVSTTSGPGLVTLVATLSLGSGSGLPQIVAGSGTTAFVTRTGGVWAINFGTPSTQTSWVTATAANKLPAGLAVSSDGSKLYVADANAIDVLNAANGTGIASYPLGTNTPASIVLGVGGTRLIVSGATNMVAIDVNSGASVAASGYATAATTGCSQLARSSDGKLIYCSFDAANSLAWFDASTLVTVGPSSTAGSMPSLDSGVSPSMAAVGGRVYAAVPTYGTAPGTPTTVSLPSAWISAKSIATGSTPQPPANVQVVTGDGQLSVSWSAPTNNGGSAITGYAVKANPGTAACTTVGSGTGCVLAGLTNGTLYSVTVTASNAVGSGPSATVSNLVPGVPGAPSTVIGTAGSKSIKASWALATNNGDHSNPILGYAVVATAVSTSSGTAATGTFTCGTGSTAVTPDLTKFTHAALSLGTPPPTIPVYAVSPSTTSCTIPGLTDGSTYALAVYAFNLNGLSGAASSAAAIASGPPAAPTGVAAAAGSGSISVSWIASAGATGYTATATSGSVSRTCTTTVTSCSISGLANGTAYTVSVIATNAAGNSASATGGSATPTAPTPPAKPGRVAKPTSKVKKSGKHWIVTISWKKPTATTISGYVVRRVGGAATAVSATTYSLAIKVSKKGTYKWTVTARNAGGNGAASTAVVVRVK